MTQKGVTSYSLSPNRQNPLAGAAHAAVFNTFRRTRHQILYWLPSMLIGYAAMQWAIEKYGTICDAKAGIWLIHIAGTSITIQNLEGRPAWMLHLSLHSRFAASSMPPCEERTGARVSEYLYIGRTEAQTTRTSSHIASHPVHYLRAFSGCHPTQGHKA